MIYINQNSRETPGKKISILGYFFFLGVGGFVSFGNCQNSICNQYQLENQYSTPENMNRCRPEPAFLHKTNIAFGSTAGTANPSLSKYQTH